MVVNEHRSKSILTAIDANIIVLIMASSNSNPSAAAPMLNNPSSISSTTPATLTVTDTPSTSAAPLRDRRNDPERSIQAFNEASRRAFNAYLARGEEPRRHFNDGQYDEYVAWCTGRIARGEAQRSQKRSTEGNYAYFSRENDGKQGLYRRPIKEHMWRKVLKKGEVFDAIGQAHFDTGHGGKYSFSREPGDAWRYRVIFCCVSPRLP
ncbi:hypothetical protein B0J12DRAFT_770906 [Macrophomina phaseolina]|uniref:Uncharacterized protein n=1 Tax=Macrophomina phaseolina TaxID=35725 RepID=A0ABQ8FX75_9PEZI|nr:hypothetical protein B0J12DRAFT_770906 [Macrophomina phaseolina]